MTPLERAAQAVDSNTLGLTEGRCKIIARAVLLAVREPSDEVIVAGKGEARYVDWDDLSDAFTAMIDAILEPGA